MKKTLLLTLALLLAIPNLLAQSGKVYLVGAGPGDPDLVTVKGAKVLGKADVVLYDALANPSILLHCKGDVRLIPVGKRSGKPSPKQEEINQLLINEALKGNTVVRLKGGDPFVFGRGGEELLALLDKGIDTEVIPGVTAAIAAPAYAGIPVTHRALARSFTLVTASTKDSNLAESVKWKSLVEQEGTIAFYMGVRVIPEICQQLIKAGMSPDTPAAIISKGTLPEQKAFRGTLKDFTPDYTDYTKLTPGLLLVGEVVNVTENYQPSKDDNGMKVLSITLNRKVSELTPRIEDGVAVATTIASKDPDKYSNDYLEMLKELEFTHIVFSNTKSVEAYFKLCEVKGINVITPKATIITLGKKITDLLSTKGYNAITLGSYNEVASYLLGDKAKAMSSSVDAVTGASKKPKAH